MCGKIRLREAVREGGPNKVAMATNVPFVVSADWLREKMDAGSCDVVVLDASFSRSKDFEAEYKKSHIVGANYFNINYKTTKTDDFPSPMPALEDFEDYARSLGVNNSSHVVIYDNSGDGGLYFGGRAWYIFTLYGLEKVSVLDNGFHDWKEKGYPTTDTISTPRRGDIVAKRRTDIYRQYEEMEENLITKKYQVLDSRPEHLYQGDPNEVRSGHIPNAVSVTFGKKLLDPATGRFRTADQLKKLFVEHGIDVSKPVVASCRTGMSACSLMMALQMAGATDYSMYHGSATEWLRKAKPENIEKSSTRL